MTVAGHLTLPTMSVLPYLRLGYRLSAPSLARMESRM